MKCINANRRYAVVNSVSIDRCYRFTQFSHISLAQQWFARPFRLPSRTIHTQQVLRSGHNKWSKIRHSKGALDSERAKLFSRLSNDIAVAVKIGGADPLFNLRLSACLTSAKKADMPKSNIEAAIKRATGRSAEGDTQSVTYEGNLASVGFIIDTLTDKKTRTVANIKSTFKKAGGNVSPSAFLFDHLGLVVVAANEMTLDSATNIAIESGAEDVELLDNEYLFWASPGVLNEVAQGIKQSGCELLEARLQYRPKSLQIVSDELRAQVDGLVDTLEADEDVVRITNTMQKRYQNE